MHYTWNIIGHEKQILALENEISEDGLTHAYLFHGPKDIGKFTVAKLFAKALLCPNSLCQKCPLCVNFERGISPDFLLMKEEGESLKIEDMRMLIAKTNLTPQGKRRIVLIEAIDRMSIEAQNAFLKTLEEPPGENIFILTSSEPKKILPTIVSRVRSYEFFLVNANMLEVGLKNRFHSSVDLAQVLEMAQGKPGLAINLLEKPLLKARYREMIFRLEDFFKKNDLLTKFNFVEEIEKDPGARELFFDLASLVLRKLTHRILYNVKSEAELDLKKIYELFEKLIESRYLSTRNVNQRLVLENFFLATEH